jgi:hypothetical protein
VGFIEINKSSNPSYGFIRKINQNPTNSFPVFEKSIFFSIERFLYSADKGAGKVWIIFINDKWKLVEKIDGGFVRNFYQLHFVIYWFVPVSGDDITAPETGSPIYKIIFSDVLTLLKATG